MLLGASPRSSKRIIVLCFVIISIFGLNTDARGKAMMHCQWRSSHRNSPSLTIVSVMPRFLGCWMPPSDL